MHPLLVVGSVAFDTIHNPLGTHPRILGGSAVFASLAASHFAPVRLVGVVGRDYPDDALRMLRERRIDLEGLEVVEGRTFHWEGRYSDDLTSRTSLCTELNVFADFHPKIPAGFRDTPYVMLGNIAPELQLEVLDQISAPQLIVTDTMNFWIEGRLEALEQVLGRTHLLVINEEEARQLAGVHNIARVARHLLALGPKTAIIKRGEYGALMFQGDQTFSVPGFPVDEVRDPTGAGDTFAGGLLGYVASQGNLRPNTLRRAVVYGSALASFCVEEMGVEGLLGLDDARIDERFWAFRKLAHFATDEEVAIGADA